MKQVLLCTLFMFSLLNFASAQKVIYPSENIVTKTHDLSNFSGLKIYSDFTAYVTFSEKTTVEIEANENMHQYISVEVVDGNLEIKQHNNLWVKGPEKLVAHITVPSLSYIAGNDDAVIELKNELTTSSLTLDLDEDSTLDGHITAGSMDLNLDEDSVATLTGNVKTLKGNIDEDSVLKSFDFIVGDLELKLSEDSSASITVENKMNVHLSEDSEMRYKGNPSILRQTVRGDSELRNVN